MRTAKRILAEFMTVVMVLQACSPTVAAVAAGWQNISNEIAAASAKALDTAESGETNGDAANGFGSSDTGAAGDSAQDGAAKDDVATGDTVDSAAGSDSTGDQTEGDDAAGDAAADDVEQDADAAVSEDAEAQAGSTITDLKKLVELLEANGAEGIELKEDNSGIKSLNVTSSEAFAALSNADASLYYDAQIKVIITGDAKLTESANNGMSFQGFGSDEHPFEGRIYRSMNGADSPVELTTNRTVFNNLKLTDQNNTVKIKWVGATTYSAPMIASKVSGGGKTLNAVVNIANSVGTDGTDTTSALTAPLLGEAMGDLTTEVTYGPAGSLEQLNVNAAGNIGLLANTVKSGTFTVGPVKFPDSLAAGGVVKTSSGNAGLLVGTVEDGATLNVGTLDVPAATVQSASGSAGGVVGLVGSNTGATVNVTEALDLHMLTVKGTTASGGFIGKATKLTLGADSKKYTCPASVGNENSMNTGGFIGEVSFASSVEFTGNDQIDTDGGVTLAGKANESNGVGAAIGKLSFVDSAATVSFKGGAFKSTYGNGGGTAVFGGLVGSVTGCANSKPLHIENVSTKFALEATPTFAGGLVGWLGRGAGATLEVKNATVNCTKLLQSSKGFGGVAGCIDNRSIADINGVTVKNEGAIENGAGIAAESWGSAIRLGGVTDFSGMKFAPDNSFTYKKVVSQITNVSSSNPTLVFARGTGSDSVPADADNADYWAYKRCPATKIDDLGSDQNAGCGYGEIVRLDGHTLRKDLIKINMDKHELEGPSTTDWSWQVGYGRSWNDGNRELTITSEKDFACFALSLQFGALWNGVYGLNPDNRGQLLGSNVTINLSANINLLGTGIGGLGFDNASNLQIFQGTFNGNGHTITLGVGEPYGIRGDNAIASNDTSDGNGKIYRHSRLGLFAAIGGGATVNNLTVDGVMKFDNGLGVDAGSLAATITGDATLNSVMCNAAITCDDSFGNDVNIGGIAGSVRGGGTVTFSSSNTGGSTKAQATVKTGATLNGNTCIGGAVGYVADVVAIVNVASLEVGDAPAGENAITAGDSASNKKSQIGGLIGCITQGIAANATNVNITGLTFNSFSMTVGKNGDAKSGAGGLLGYSWGNTVVTIGDSSKNTSDSTYALKTNNASITANSSGELGGLVYAASGQWVINNYAIDLSGATINAKSATTLGLLVGRGSKVASGVYGSESYTGLYLEDRAYWGTAYKVSGIKITAPDITTFDEWVGNGVKPGSKLMDGEWNTVVSLHTKDDVNEGKLDMSGEKGSDNSYHNRSDFGKNHNTNAWTRYYYNLDKAYAKVGNNPENNSRANFMDSPEYLLLWCAYLYAPSDIRSYIIPGNQQIFQGNNIGTNDGTRVSIDMNGYSFYPSNPASGSKVTVKNADIKFHYSKIKAEQNGNKKNSEATQHENMHCGLIRTHAGDLTVNNVTLGGTVGSLVKDAGSSSGALVCRYIYGSSTSVKQISIDNLTLDGLTVDGVTDKTDYAPLLINEMQTYVNLNATNISTKGYGGDTKAATSLFGRLGVGSTADQVTATFSAISLPSATDNAMFTRASLLESFGYGEGKTGSAVFTFMKDDQTNEKVTFGSEIDSKGEYSGKQLWYYDESTYGTPAGLVTVDNKEANADTPQFGGYLPYVKKGNVNENKVQYHEIKVNQRVPKLTTGCGTYGDPYAITKASELNTVAEYINTQNAIDGWEVTIAANQEELCQRRSSSEKPENEVTYIYKQAKKSGRRRRGKVPLTPITR